jgi:hypothetical protein
MNRVVQRCSSLLVVLVGTVSLLVITAIPAGAATSTTRLCSGGSLSLTVNDGPGSNRINIIQRAESANGYRLINITRGLTWRNERTGATGTVDLRAVAAPNGRTWERRQTITTGRGDVVVTWPRAAVSETRSCLTVTSLRTRGTAR